MSIGRNDPCPCGSGKKYKRCCLITGGPDHNKRSQQVFIGIVVIVVAALVGTFTVSEAVGGVIGAVGIAVLGIWIWMTTDPPAAGGGADPSAINFGR